MLYAPPLHARRPNDFYKTPRELAIGLRVGLRCAGMDLPTPIHDPCAGDGCLIDRLGLDGSGSDLFPGDYPSDRRLSTTPTDARDLPALTGALNGARAIVTNPPYDRDALPIVENAVELVFKGAVEMAAMLLPAPWEAAGTPRRVALMRAMNLRIVCGWRPVWIEGTNGGGKQNFAWYVWTRDTPPFPRLQVVTLPDVEVFAA
jgi:hypothetical protein